jgi:ornithine cyclodeaminase/alanine dehydrogenase
MTLLLNVKDIRELISMTDTVNIVDRTYRSMGEGKVINPTKVSLDLGETGNYPYYEGYMNAMPAYIDWLNMAGMKWIGGFDGGRNAAGLPYMTGMILLLDPHVGRFLSAMDGSYITNLRTGAQTAVALSYFKDLGDSISVGLFGAGTQARTQVLAITKRFKINRLVVWNHRRSTAEAFKEDVAHLVDGEIIIVDKPEEATDNDVLITVTGAIEPFITGDMIKPGTIIMPMGSRGEITDDIILKADHIYVDHVEQALHRGALKKLNEEGKLSPDDITADFGELATTQKEATHDKAKDITIVIPIGIGALDVAVAGHIYHGAVEKGSGSHFDFDLLSTPEGKDYMAPDLEK